MKALSYLSQLRLPCLLALLGFAPWHQASAQTWVDPGMTNLPWQAVAASADGKILAAAYSRTSTYSTNGGIFYKDNGGIWVSTNSGASWTQTSAPNEGWSAIAASADGHQLIAGTGTVIAGSNTRLYISRDSGQTWNTNLVGGGPFNSIASSADGTVLAVAGSGLHGGTYISTNGGDAWTLYGTNFPLNTAYAVAMSADGTTIMSMRFVDVMVSTNSGTTWVTTTNTLRSASSLAGSADGTKWFVLNHTTILTSTNLGVTWKPLGSQPTNCNCIAVSADGTKLVAAAGPATKVYYPDPGLSIGNYPLYTSTDSGATWTSNNVPMQHWSAMTCSADGSRLIAAGDSISSTNGFPWGKLWVGEASPQPALHLTQTDNQVQLSWTIPTADLGVQESSDLISWTDVSNPPVLNLPRLQRQVQLPVGSGSHFYRLKSASPPASFGGRSAATP